MRIRCSFMNAKCALRALVAALLGKAVGDVCIYQMLLLN